MYEDDQSAFDWMEASRYRSEEESKKEGEKSNKNKLN